MHSLSFTLSVLLAFVAVHAAPQGQPSGAPSCTYNCPQADEAGFALGTSSDDGTNLFCSYPAFAGENPDDFYCKYSDSDATLSQDSDAGFCPARANPGSCQARRRSAVPRAPAPPMAAPVARAPTPEEIKIRASLKRRKPVPVEA
ncbi:hypothetical protein K443DRAFT_675196 [Laccaria amethystina LaAM-08-1]|uniref:Uncharacterized protein n=1 Tax=Laccaria amethystina LaAM-08-1 TaxID=1095629 RepID=A0A0C9YBF4_9AGAR|nr:hypothetical protein K443DRAFT_675196 [Laccaria amethystina LaAM-08-1]